MSDIIGVLVAIAISLVVGIGVIHFENRMTINQSQQLLAEKVASQYTEFANALNAYVNADFNSNIMGIVNCSTLQTDNFLSASFSCTDPLGEALQGDISEPWGFPQSWVVYPSTTPNQNELAKYGINSELQWKAFTYQVAVDVQGIDNSMSAFSVYSDSNSDIGMFIQPQSSVSDDLSNYFPVSGTEFAQTSPSLAYNDNYSFFMAPALQKEPDYWVFDVTITDTYDNGNPSSSPAAITYSNLGDSAVCPSSGITPSYTSNWKYNIDSPPSGSVLNNTTIPGQSIYYTGSFYLCIPAAKNIINTTSAPFQNIGPVTSLNYGSDEVEVTSGQTFNGDNDSVGSVSPQAGRVYQITSGMALYTFLVFWTNYASGYYNSGSYNVVWGQYGAAGAVLWIGENNNICVESSGMQPAIEVSPYAWPPCWNAINDLGITDINLG